MSKSLVVFLSLAVLTVGYLAYYTNNLTGRIDSDYSSRNTVIKSLPKLNSFKDLAGNKFDLQTLVNGNEAPIIVHFWATWCAPCEKEFPDLMDFTLRNQDTKFVIVAVADTLTNIKKFIARKSLESFTDLSNIIWLMDEENVSQQFFGTYKLPESFFFDGQGTLINRVLGEYDWSKF